MRGACGYGMRGAYEYEMHGASGKGKAREARVGTVCKVYT
jgi:hypothetical protein